MDKVIMPKENNMNQKFLVAIEYILNECHKSPDDSVVDIANEAFEKAGIDKILGAVWNDETEDKPPVSLVSNAYLQQASLGITAERLAEILEKVNENMPIAPTINPYVIFATELLKVVRIEEKE